MLDQQHSLLDWVAVINAFGNLIALIIHAMRVPYRESAAKEQIQATDSIIRVRKAQHDLTDPPHLPPPPPK